MNRKITVELHTLVPAGGWEALGHALVGGRGRGLRKM